MKFWSPLDLHYSQTEQAQKIAEIGFGALWIYTTLKHSFYVRYQIYSFGALWIYTTLKLSMP